MHILKNFFLLNKKSENNNKFSLNTTDTYFIAAGRLTKQKNFIYLINEFEKFCDIYPKEKLLIFGEGELENKLIENFLINLKS